MATVARLGTLRLGRGRLNVYSPIRVKLLIAGTNREAQLDKTTLEVEDNLRDAYNYARFSCFGFTPSVGQEVILGLGETNFNRLFAGRIQKVTQQPADPIAASARTRYHVTAVDWTWDLDELLVLKTYVDEPITNIVLDIISTYTSGFTTQHVQTGLASLSGSIDFTKETVSACLTRLANAIGGYWYVDELKDLHFFTSEALGYGPETVSTSAVFPFHSVSHDTDIAQIRTRVGVEGATAQVSEAHTDPTLNAADLYVAEPGVVFADPVAIGVETFVRVKTAVMEYDSVVDGPVAFGLLNIANADAVSFRDGPLVAVPGDEISQFVTRNDTAAQTAHATLTGRSGIREAYIQDHRLSYDGCITRGDAELDMFGGPIETFRYTTRDPNVRSGLPVPVNFASAPHSSMNGTYIITRVVTRLLEESTDLHPERQVEAMSVLTQDFYSVLRRLEQRAGARAAV